MSLTPLDETPPTDAEAWAQIKAQRRDGWGWRTRRRSARGAGSGLAGRPMWRWIELSRGDFVRALRASGGSIAATSRRLRISEHAVRKRLADYGLVAEADRLRALHGVTGQRTTLGQDVPVDVAAR